jgi:hypothetical protein
VAVDLDRLQHGLGQELVPAVALGDLVDVVQQALVDDVAELLGGIELRGRRRVATGNAVDGDRARLLAQGDGGVDPDAALGLVGLGQRLGGGGFTARRPPVDDFGLQRLGGGREGRGGEQGGGQGVTGDLQCLLPAPGPPEGGPCNISFRNWLYPAREGVGRVNHSFRNRPYQRPLSFSVRCCVA